MRSIVTVSLAILVAVVMTGCVTNTITNLTPTQLPRNTNGVYTVELAWDSNQQSMRDWTVTPTVVVGFDTYEMRPTLGMKNRWEAQVPVPAGTDSVNYHFKVDYEYNKVGGSDKASKLSRIYTLDIADE